MNIRNLRKRLDLINSEGPILALYETPTNELLLGAMLNNGGEVVYFGTNHENLFHFLLSEITLHELYNLNPDEMVYLSGKRKITSHLKLEFIDRLQCGNILYCDLPKGMGSPQSINWLLEHRGNKK